MKKRNLVAVLSASALVLMGMGDLSLQGAGGAEVVSAATVYATLDRGVQAQVEAKSMAIPVIISVRPIEPLLSVDEELAKIPLNREIQAKAIEVKELEVAKAGGKAIDETKLVALKADLKSYVNQVQPEVDAKQQHVTGVNADRFKKATDKWKADTAGLQGIRLVSVESDGLIRAVVTHQVVMKIAALPMVTAILSDTETPVVPALASAAPNAGANQFWKYGKTGNGMIVSVMGGGAKDHSALSISMHKDFTGDSTPVNDHETQVAGAVQSQDTTEKGPAHSTTLWDVKNVWVDSTGTFKVSTTTTSNALDWIVSGTPANVNVYSYQVLGDAIPTYENLFDYYADKYPTLLVGSNGNSSSASIPVAPASSKNSISITSYDDGNRIPADRSLDTMASFSIPGPTPDGRKKPDLAAPGVSINLPTGTSGWKAVQGTSFSAPLTGGIAAQIMEDLKASGVTDNYQLRTKAILINSANGKVGTKTTHGWWDPYWGWGQIDAKQAWYDDLKTAIAGVGPSGSTNLYFNASAGEWHKLTLVWKRHMVNTTTEDYFSDLDLKVYDPNGNLLDSSLTAKESVEQVKFKAAVSGTYRVEVKSYNSTKSEGFILAARAYLRTTP